MPFDHSIESDSYDRAAFERLKADSPTLQEIEDNGSKLLPHFDGFLLDLFALLFKLNRIWHPREEVQASALFYRAVLEQIQASPALEVIRRQSVLEETIAGMATALLAGQILELLRKEVILSRTDMLDYWSFHRQEEEIESNRDDATTAGALKEQVPGQASQRQLEDLQRRIERQNRTASRALRQKANHARIMLEEHAGERRRHIERELQRTQQGLDAASRDAEAWGAQLGGGGFSSPGRKIELGTRLARNPKLRRLAHLVGRMRESARALRRTLFERSNAETYAVGTGSDLSHLLPGELLGLRHPALRRDFIRRFLDGELLVYALRAREQKSRGPMVVCLDGSSSMAGEKEIWAKAMTLTLLDLARRQRRRFRSICFSSSGTPLQVLEAPVGTRFASDTELVFQIAEYFPGGGTDFRPPLDSALECLRTTPFRRGDVVLITDGECRLDPDWLEAFRHQKQELGFSLFSILIDVGPSSLGSLRELSDRITSVSQLTSESGRDIFLEV